MPLPTHAQGLSRLYLSPLAARWRGESPNLRTLRANSERGGASTRLSMWRGPSPNPLPASRERVQRRHAKCNCLAPMRRGVGQSGSAASFAEEIPACRAARDAVPPSAQPPCGLQRRSAPDQRCDRLVEVFDRQCSRMLFAIDVERRRCFNLELLRAPVPHLLNLGEQILVIDAGFEALLGEAGLLGDSEERRKWFFHRP